MTSKHDGPELQSREREAVLPPSQRTEPSCSGLGSAKPSSVCFFQHLPLLEMEEIANHRWFFLCAFCIFAQLMRNAHGHSSGEHWGEGSPPPAGSSPSMKQTVFTAKNDLYRSLWFMYKSDLYFGGFFINIFALQGDAHGNAL